MSVATWSSGSMFGAMASTVTRSARGGSLSAAAGYPSHPQCVLENEAMPGSSCARCRCWGRTRRGVWPQTSRPFDGTHECWASFADEDRPGTSSPRGVVLAVSKALPSGASEARQVLSTHAVVRARGVSLHLSSTVHFIVVRSESPLRRSTCYQRLRSGQEASA